MALGGGGGWREGGRRCAARVVGRGPRCCCCCDWGWAGAGGGVGCRDCRCCFAEQRTAIIKTGPVPAAGSGSGKGAARAISRVVRAGGGKLANGGLFGGGGSARPGGEEPRFRRGAGGGKHTHEHAAGGGGGWGAARVGVRARLLLGGKEGEPRALRQAPVCLLLGRKARASRQPGSPPKLSRLAKSLSPIGQVGAIGGGGQATAGSAMMRSPQSRWIPIPPSKFCAFKAFHVCGLCGQGKESERREFQNYFVRVRTFPHVCNLSIYSTANICSESPSQEVGVADCGPISCSNKSYSK